MTIKLSKLWPLAVLSALIVIAMLGSRASATSPAVQAPPTPTQKFVLHAVPIAQQMASFEALRAPAAAADSLPLAVRQKLAVGEQAQSFGVEPSALRSVQAGGRGFYVAPSEKGVCIYLDDGSSVCSDNMEALKKNGLSFSVVPAPSGRVSQGMNTVGQGTITTYGIAPDGVSSIEGETSTGEVVQAHMNLGAYVLDTDHPVTRMSFHTASTTWQTEPGGAEG